MKDIIETAKRVLALSEAADRVLRETRDMTHPELEATREQRDIATAWGDFAHRSNDGPGQIAAVCRWAAAVAPLVERLRVLGDAVCNDHRPTCESASYGSGCHGPADEDVSFWRAAFALLAADAAARGGA